MAATSAPIAMSRRAGTTSAAPVRARHERADRESDLDRHRQERCLEPVDLPFRGDERRHGGGAEPRDKREDDRGRQGEEDPPAPRWLVDHPDASARKDSTRSS